MLRSLWIAKTGMEGQQTGYTDRAITQNRYRITFTGNSATPRETVESYLLLRAAEVTRAAGFSSFMFDTRNTKANHSYQTVPYGPPDPFWGRPGKPNPHRQEMRYRLTEEELIARDEPVDEAAWPVWPAAWPPQGMIVRGAGAECPPAGS